MSLPHMLDETVTLSTGIQVNARFTFSRNVAYVSVSTPVTAGTRIYADYGREYEVLRADEIVPSRRLDLRIIKTGAPE